MSQEVTKSYAEKKAELEQQLAAMQAEAATKIEEAKKKEAEALAAFNAAKLAYETILKSLAEEYAAYGYAPTAPKKPKATREEVAEAAPKVLAAMKPDTLYSPDALATELGMSKELVADCLRHLREESRVTDNGKANRWIQFKR